jgi:hypothetical protein
LDALSPTLTLCAAEPDSLAAAWRFGLDRPSGGGDDGNPWIPRNCGYPVCRGTNLDCGPQARAHIVPEGTMADAIQPRSAHVTKYDAVSVAVPQSSASSAPRRAGRHDGLVSKRRGMRGRKCLAVAALVLAGCSEDRLTPVQPGGIPTTAADRKANTPVAPTARLLATLDGAFGSTVGPGGALFVTEPAAGRISLVDPKTGAVTTFASGLPSFPAFGGGVYDVAFIGQTAYALVTLVGPDVGGSDVVGIYRVDGPNRFTIIADIGAFSIANPPETDFFVPTGVPFALEPFRGGFLVTDGHHNRVLYVTLDGEVTEFIAFGNIVPTGLAVSGNTIYMAQAGPVPHLPQNGKVLAFGPKSTTATVVASGARLLVEVEFGRGRTLFALSQGVWAGMAEGDPALPNTGTLVTVNGDGTFTAVTGGLDRPTSLEFIGDTAYVVSLTGKIWAIDNASGPPFGASR